MNRAVCGGEQAHDRRPVIEVDHDRAGTASSNGLGLGVVPDERRHLVAMLLQFRQYVRSDETGCAGECDSHLSPPRKLIKRLLELITDGESCQSRRLSCLGGLAG